MPMRRTPTDKITLSPFDIEVLTVLRDDDRRWLTVDQIAAALRLDDTPRDRTRVLAALSWMARPKAALVLLDRRTLEQKTVYTLTTRGESDLKRRAQPTLEGMAG